LEEAAGVKVVEEEVVAVVEAVVTHYKSFLNFYEKMSFGISFPFSHKMF
jgi:hypothetical protein